MFLQDSGEMRREKAEVCLRVVIARGESPEAIQASLALWIASSLSLLTMTVISLAV